jgi:tuftelin-interacting protein 11
MISDEEEVEKFEITDYDIENEFNPNKRKRLSKNKQTYGECLDVANSFELL